MKSELEIKQEMCEIGRRVYNRGMVAANDGNFSVKLSDDEFLCTPTGVSKGFMTPEFICKVNVLCVSAVINIAYESERETVTAMA